MDHLLKRHDSEGNRPTLSGGVLERLYDHHWPGNVRELQNLLQRYISLNRLDFITPGAPGRPLPNVCPWRPPARRAARCGRSCARGAGGPFKGPRGEPLAPGQAARSLGSRSGPCTASSSSIGSISGISAVCGSRLVLAVFSVCCGNFPVSFCRFRHPAVHPSTALNSLFDIRNH